MLLAACSLASIGYLDAVQPARARSNEALFKARVLKEMSIRMCDIRTATSEATISALLLLTSFEVSWTIWLIVLHDLHQMIMS